MGKKGRVHEVKSSREVDSIVRLGMKNAREMFPDFNVYKIKCPIGFGFSATLDDREFRVVYSLAQSDRYEVEVGGRTFSFSKKPNADRVVSVNRSLCEIIAESGVSFDFPRFEEMTANILTPKSGYRTRSFFREGGPNRGYSEPYSRDSKHRFSKADLRNLGNL